MIKIDTNLQHNQSHPSTPVSAQWSGPRNQDKKDLTIGGLPKYVHEQVTQPLAVMTTRILQATALCCGKATETIALSLCLKARVKLQGCICISDREQQGAG